MQLYVIIEVIWKTMQIFTIKSKFLSLEKHLSCFWILSQSSSF